MKIINLDKREPYQLAPEAKIEVERTNPFFNDYTELTVPMDLPASDHNRRLLGFPDLFGGRAKMVAGDVSIQDGEFHSQCRMAVLSATRKNTIQVSFYLNDGSFYSRIQNVKLKDVFTSQEDTIQFASMDEAIRYCRGLRSNQDTRLTIFPILVENDSGLTGGYNYKILNSYGKQHYFDDIEDASMAEVINLYELYLSMPCWDPDDNSTGSDFFNATTRTEIVNSMAITLEPGYWISPFIRANYVLSRVFSHFGYTLESNFFTQTSPFDKMVLLNNVIDPLVNLKLRMADLVPDVTVPDMLSAFRKKFCCEFSVDEGKKSVQIVFLKDVLSAAPVADLTRRMTAEPTVNYKTEKEYSRVKLSPEKTLDGDSEDGYDDLKAMQEASPAAYFNPKTGCFIKDGYSGDYLVQTKIGEASQPYDTGEDMEPQEIKIPECIPEFRNLEYSWSDEDGNVKSVSFGQFLYIGKYNTLNSTMAVTGEDNQEATESVEKLLPMFAFTYLSSNHANATISPYNVRRISSMPQEMTKMWNYALYYNGEDGIFERFYRDYDLLLRNSLQKTKVRLLLSQSEKQNLPAWGRVTIRGVCFFLNKLKFVLGGKADPVESELLTTGLYEPVSEAPTISEMLPMMASDYKWERKGLVEESDVSEYSNAGVNKERTFQTVYPPLPSAEWLNKRWGEQVSYTRKKTRHKTWFRSAKYAYTKTTVWLECVHK